MHACALTYKRILRKELVNCLIGNVNKQGNTKIVFKRCRRHRSQISFERYKRAKHYCIEMRWEEQGKNKRNIIDKSMNI